MPWTKISTTGFMIRRNEDVMSMRKVSLIHNHRKPRGANTFSMLVALSWDDDGCDDEIDCSSSQKTCDNGRMRKRVVGSELPRRAF